MLLITHSGHFHLDEVLATVILLKIYPYASLERTRDEPRFRFGDIVYDVGGVFDPTRRRFDHHQPDFTETFSSKYKVKLRLRDRELCAISGIPGCNFVHINGFTGSNKTKEGAFKMCEKSLLAIYKK
ncbi:MYG1 exonuclease-like [Arctopsyche grandis]|uniref:MYG1 exonuclease-like n=1 Tax=Arctopsyche grandis TaxID=121162 RepID=UPI00406D7ECA